ncbi:MAG: peptide chain release factor aRF-1 [Candidatus Parvarchaeota archaeon]|nr:peptide chain release factor aRF-1 [Candidatus Jingweiarchaeum tengchongense]MCW1298396.1 peptide chain release factor aRF-1 [Candidatus Jingweiarchaeum tengchongense]MCW1300302.1 peptide chain release factor aRF-1 [Candidatus Jingweiarchaeum tengchongense]MCW1304902.1 peptide chain release factor aRF-1 [Candidatus Jingweiarchaeum tengchongense]MCW1305798.1 peptide chain release factor aRF-1 [Candidatus Jingweiarchaeum tengchongense]
MEEIEKYKLKNLIKELEKIKGRHTELITVYVPAGGDLNSVRNQLIQEQSTAENIKLKTTRKNVLAALEKIIQELKLYKKTPENGLVIFCGNTSKEEGLQDVKLWILEPPEPISIRLYRCDQEFILEPLKKMLEAKYVYGLIVIDNSQAAIGFLKGKTIVCEKEMDSIVPGKFRKGGQSAKRFEKVRENLAKDWYKKVADEAKNAFSKENIKGILIGGPGPVKETFVNGDFLPGELKSKVIGVKDIGYSDESGLYELVNRSTDLLEKEEIIEEKKVLNDFLTKIASNSDMVAYGEEEVRKMIMMGAVDLLLISEEVGKEKIEEFLKIAKDYGSNVFIASSETAEGVQLKELGGFGAILRFKTNVS